MRSTSLILWAGGRAGVAGALGGCAQPVPELREDAALTELWTGRLANERSGRKSPVVGLETPVERARKAVLPELAQVEYRCEESTFGKDRLSFTVTMRSGASHSGSRARSCYAALRAARVVFEANGPARVFTSGEALSDNASKSELGALNEAINSSAIALEGK